MQGQVRAELANMTKVYDFQDEAIKRGDKKKALVIDKDVEFKKM